jgi:4-alpha-glucanotransferase
VPSDEGPDYRRWGIEPGYHATNGGWRDAPIETLRAIAEAMGARAGDPPPPPFLSRRPGEALPARCDLELEDGGQLAGVDRLPPDMPFGYHRLSGPDGEAVLAVTPGRCVLPAAAAWGWAVQLYALRSARSWGMGDLGDLRDLRAWAGRSGAGFVLLNPLHAALPDLPQESSPYFASSRCFRNPLYLRVEDIPGAGRLPDFDALASQGRALSDGARIDRDAVWRVKWPALRALWRQFRERGGDPDFERYCREEGPLLDRYATFCALAEVHGRPWTSWPVAVRHPDRSAVTEFQTSAPEQVGFHRWLQWLLDLQLRQQPAGHRAPVGLLQDLAIGTAPTGADAWLWQDCLALGMRVGAPPDDFNTRGQDWGLPPFDPWRLGSTGYEPYRRILRAGMRHAAGLRVDHVMGLFRLFWIPEGEGPDAGAYVRYPANDLLDILALESHRAGAYVVGEDLGTVEDEVRAELAERNILSYRLFWFEAVPPRRFPHRALAAVTTHDLPTVAGLWTGEDLAAQRALGLAPNVEGTIGLRDRLRDWGGLDDSAPTAAAVEAAYDLLSQAPSLLVVATLDDALRVEERPNMPGTVDEWPNWSIPLPERLEELEADPKVETVAALLRRHRGGAGSP